MTVCWTPRSCDKSLSCRSSKPLHLQSWSTSFVWFILRECGCRTDVLTRHSLHHAYELHRCIRSLQLHCSVNCVTLLAWSDAFTLINFTEVEHAAWGHQKNSCADNISIPFQEAEKQATLKSAVRLVSQICFSQLKRDSRNLRETHFILLTNSLAGNAVNWVTKWQQPVLST